MHYTFPRRRRRLAVDPSAAQSHHHVVWIATSQLLLRRRWKRSILHSPIPPFPRPVFPWDSCSRCRSTGLVSHYVAVYRFGNPCSRPPGTLGYRTQEPSNSLPAGGRQENISLMWKSCQRLGEEPMRDMCNWEGRPALLHRGYP